MMQLRKPSSRSLAAGTDRRAALALAIVALATALAAPAGPAWSQALPPNLSAADAHAAAVAGRVVLIDIRTPQEWKETGVPASAHAITMHQTQEGFLSALAAATNGSKAAPIALICAVGNRSANLSGWLRRAGYTAISDVGEGMLGGSRGRGWIKAGLPVRPWSGQTHPAPAP